MTLNADEIRKLIKHYDELAAKWEYEYQDNGKPSSQRAWERNEAMADALRAALGTQEDRRQLADIKVAVMELDVDGEPEELAQRVRSLQERVSEGRL